MNYLLDTHILIWSHTSPDKLSKTIKQIVSSPENTIYVSAVSFWEISLKYSLRKLDIKGVRPEDFLEYSLKAGFEITNLQAEIAVSLHNLPETKNKDPFDRMLAWQAINKDYYLITKDAAFTSLTNYGLKIVW